MIKMKRLLFVVFCVTFFAHASASDEVTIEQLQLMGLPVVQIETVGAEEPTYEIADPPEGCWGGSIKNATKVPGRVVVSDADGILYDSGDYVAKQSGMTVKVRGNWSARRAKKPFKVKLQKKGDMLGRGDDRFKDKDWVLLPYFDLNYMVGLKVSELMSMVWTPQYRFVNVVFNGDYRGLYMLMESVGRNTDCRLNVDKSGCIVELDAYWWNEDFYLESAFVEPMNYTFKYPDTEDLTEEQTTYIANVLHEAEQSTLDGTYEEKLDVESFARWMLTHDILGNIDGAGSNIYLTKYDNTPETLLKMGCLWDYDVIMKSEGWDELHDRYYFGRLFNSENRTFAECYASLWDEVKTPLFENIAAFLEEYLSSDLRQQVDASIVLNNKRWGGKGDSSAQNSAACIPAAQAYFQSRKPWLEEHVPSVLTTIAVGHAERISDNAGIYDMTGRRLTVPPTKGFYIKDGHKFIMR